VIEVNGKSYLKIADHGIENGGLGSKYYFMRLPGLGAIQNGKIRELSRIKGAANVSIAFKACIIICYESSTYNFRASIGLTGAA
jgi:hypothetical protein